MNAGAGGVQATLALAENRRWTHLMGGAQPGPWAQTFPSTQGAGGSSLCSVSFLDPRGWDGARYSHLKTASAEPRSCTVPPQKTGVLS
jgi:hypothetical protein